MDYDGPFPTSLFDFDYRPDALREAARLYRDFAKRTVAGGKSPRVAWEGSEGVMFYAQVDGVNRRIHMTATAYRTVAAELETLANINGEHHESMGLVEEDARSNWRQLQDAENDHRTVSYRRRWAEGDTERATANQRVDDAQRVLTEKIENHERYVKQAQTLRESYARVENESCEAVFRSLDPIRDDFPKTGGRELASIDTLRTTNHAMDMNIVLAQSQDLYTMSLQQGPQPTTVHIDLSDAVRSLLNFFEIRIGREVTATAHELVRLFEAGIAAVAGFLQVDLDTTIRITQAMADLCGISTRIESWKVGGTLGVDIAGGGRIDLTTHQDGSASVETTSYVEVGAGQIAGVNFGVSAQDSTQVDFLVAAAGGAASGMFKLTAKRYFTSEDDAQKYMNAARIASLTTSAPLLGVLNEVTAKHPEGEPTITVAARGKSTIGAQAGIPFVGMAGTMTREGEVFATEHAPSTEGETRYSWGVEGTATDEVKAELGEKGGAGGLAWSSGAVKDSTVRLSWQYAGTPPSTGDPIAFKLETQTRTGGWMFGSGGDTIVKESHTIPLNDHTRPILDQAESLMLDKKHDEGLKMLRETAQQHGESTESKGKTTPDQKWSLNAQAGAGVQVKISSSDSNTHNESVFDPQTGKYEDSSCDG